MAIITAEGLSDNGNYFNKNGSVLTLKKISETEWLLFGDVAEGESEGFPPTPPPHIGNRILVNDYDSPRFIGDGSNFQLNPFVVDSIDNEQFAFFNEVMVYGYDDGTGVEAIVVREGETLSLPFGVGRDFGSRRKISLTTDGNYLLLDFQADSASDSQLTVYDTSTGDLIKQSSITGGTSASKIVDSSNVVVWRDSNRIEKTNIITGTVEDLFGGTDYPITRMSFATPEALWFISYNDLYRFDFATKDVDILYGVYADVFDLSGDLMLVTNRSQQKVQLVNTRSMELLGEYYAQNNGWNPQGAWDLDSNFILFYFDPSRPVDGGAPSLAYDKYSREGDFLSTGITETSANDYSGYMQRFVSYDATPIE